MSKYFTPYRNSNPTVRKLLTGGSPNASHNAFLDANVIGKLMVADYDPISFIENTLRASGEKNVESVNIITSPFALFEYLGLEVPKPAELKFSRSEFKDTPAPEIITKALNYALDFYKDPANLDLRDLRERTVEMRKYVSKNAQILLDGIVKPFTTPNRVEIVRQNLAWDFAMNLQVPGSAHETYYRDVMTGLGYFHTEGTNFVYSKPAAEVMKHSIKMFLRENRGHKEAAEARSTLSFKTKGDHLDREIIHFALVGWHYNTGMPLKTHCLTADPVVEVETRIVNLGIIYSQYYTKQWQEYWKSEIGKVAKALPGAIHCLDPESLEIVRSFDSAGYFSVSD